MHIAANNELVRQSNEEDIYFTYDIFEPKPYKYKFTLHEIIHYSLKN